MKVDPASPSPSTSVPSVHVLPHSAHLHPGQPGHHGETSVALEEEDDHDYESLPIGHGWGTNMLAGALAGISEHAAIFPVDSIKTRMQVLPSLNPTALLNLNTAGAATSAATASATASSSLSSSTTSALKSTATPSAANPAAMTAAANRQALTTFSQHLRSVSTGEGIRTLWRGVASVIMGAGPAHAAHFGMYEFVREISGGRGDGWGGVGGTAVAGAAATITSDALMNPFDVIKQRMQIRNSPHRSVFSCARSVYASEGLSAFYVSYPTTITMTIPFTAVQFSAYESLKGLINPSGVYSPMTHIVAGGVAGGLAAAVTTPLDVAKTRGSSDDPRIRNARGMGEALRIIRERDGWKGLRRGMLPRVMTVAPSTAISWMSYEFFKVLIRQNGALPETGKASPR